MRVYAFVTVHTWRLPLMLWSLHAAMAHVLSLKLLEDIMGYDAQLSGTATYQLMIFWCGGNIQMMSK